MKKTTELQRLKDIIAIMKENGCTKVSLQDITVEIGSKENIISEKTNVANELTITAPLVGMLKLKDPNTLKPYVKVGDYVDENCVVAVIEAMKVMNPISALRSGVVKEVLVKASEPVEFNQWLLIIE